MMKGVAPLFITGTWRCGSTLISRIMNSHPDMDVVYDLVHFMRFCYDQYNPIEDDSNIKKLIADVNQRIFERYHLSFCEKAVFESLEDRKDYPSIYHSIMTTFLLSRSGKSIWGEKTNLAWSKIPQFFYMFPEGRVLHIVRDPRAVLASWKRFTNAPKNDYLDSILNSYDSMEKALQYTEQFSGYRYLYITYENLVMHPQKTVNEICEKFDVPFYEEMLDFSGLTDNFGKKWKSNTVRNEALNGISSDMVNRWRDELDMWEIVLTERIMDGFLSKFGYTMTSDMREQSQSFDTAIREICKSELTLQGMLKFLLFKEGFERYPTNPLCKENWEKIKVED